MAIKKFFWLPFFFLADFGIGDMCPIDSLTLTFYLWSNEFLPVFRLFFLTPDFDMQNVLERMKMPFLAISAFKILKREYK